MPFRNNKRFKSDEDYNKFFREYRKSRGEVHKKYQREYMAKYRKEHPIYYSQELKKKNAVRKLLRIDKEKIKNSSSLPFPGVSN